MAALASTDEPTRLLFTGLHPSVAAHHLREQLNRCPPSAPRLTDLKVLAKPNGQSRCIAFAGFKAHDDAERVRTWAAGAWVAGDKGGTRVRVDWAKDTRDAPRPAKRARVEKPSATAAGSQDDRFNDFMALMAPKKSLLESAPSAVPADFVPPPSSAAPVASTSTSATPAAPSPAPKPSTSATQLEEEEPEAPADGAAEDEELTDAEYLARRMKRLQDEKPVEDVEPEFFQPEDGPAEAQVGEGAGKAEDAVHIPTDASTKSSKGIAYVTFRRPEDAVSAFDALDGTTFQGRLLHLLPAVGRAARAAKKEGQATVKEERLEQRKKQSGQAFSWGTLYLNADAALSAVADRLGVSKSSLLDPSSSDPAVKVALAEAHTLAEIKRYFEGVSFLSRTLAIAPLTLIALQENVNVEAFGKPGPRSSTCILVKNLPYGTTSASLSTLFSPFGTVGRVLVPPSGTIAIVEMADADATSAAWRGLVYKQFGGSVLYLEKAPASIWAGAGPKPDTSATASTLPVVRPATSGADASSSETAAPGATLFVKNLNFETTQPRLKSAFDSLPDFVFARVQTKPDPKNPGRTLSMGFGFVGFRTPAAAAAAKDARQGYTLDGHALDVRFAQRNADKPGDGEEKKGAKGGAKDTTTKLLVKNVPFEATRAELRQLFGAYGQLKSVRLPRKMDNKTRGFAFLEFATRRDAESAFAALEHTHLLGRHLVLQWATEADEENSKGGVLSLGKKGTKRKFVMQD
ncbi:Multiple RNA-binding domain-containing protein 1 [Rhodosporidiobolus nylandii]